MNVFISTDMEGTAGVVHWDQVNITKPEYEAPRRWMMAEVNAAIEGALEAGAERVLVNDSHWTMRNLLLDRLHPRVELISGNLKPLGMMAGIDGSFGCAFFTGYHARAGQFGILTHTYSDENVARVRVNGIEVGELGLNALVAGHFGVPPALATGDNCLVAEARDLLGDIEAVQVKEALTYYSARSLPHEEACRAIREAAKRAVLRARNGEFKPFKLKAPFKVEATLHQPSKEDACSFMPGVRRVDGTTVAYTANDAVEAYEAFRTMVRLAGTS